MEGDSKKQLLVVKIGAAIIALIIVGIWLVSLRYVWRETAEKSTSTSETDWDSLSAEIGASFDRLNESLDGIATTTTVLVEQSVDEKTDKDRQSADEILKETMQNLGSTTDLLPTPVASSTMPAKDTRGCPAWVNCMPTIGGPAPSCAIPPGCEGVTELVY